MPYSSLVSFAFAALAFAGGSSALAQATSYSSGREEALVHVTLEITATTENCAFRTGGFNPRESCYISFRNLRPELPPGGRIVAAVRSATAGVFVELQSREGGSPEGVRLERREALDALLATGAVKIQLIYQGPSLRRPGSVVPD